MVSGSISLRCSRFFSPFPHGTGTLSVSQEYLALADGPAGFTQGFTCPALLRIPLSLTLLARTGLSPISCSFPTASGSSRKEYCGPTTPSLPKQQRFGLFRFRSPLLSESLLFSLPSGTEMFHFPEFPPHTLYIQARVTGHDSSWVSPFGHPRIKACLTAPRGLSWPTTSFIASSCQGIHHVRFVA